MVDASMLAQGIHIRIQRVMKELQLSQSEVAARSGVSRQFVSLVCAGKNVPGAAMLAGLRASLGVSLDWLLLDAGPMFAALPPELPAPEPPPLVKPPASCGPLHHLADRAAASVGPGVVEIVLKGLASQDEHRRTRSA